jgi:hypothetical protein
MVFLWFFCVCQGGGQSSWIGLSGAGRKRRPQGLDNSPKMCDTTGVEGTASGVLRKRSRRWYRKPAERLSGRSKRPSASTQVGSPTGMTLLTPPRRCAILLHTPLPQVMPGLPAHPEADNRRRPRCFLTGIMYLEQLKCGKQNWNWCGIPMPLFLSTHMSFCEQQEPRNILVPWDRLPQQRKPSV